MARTDKSERTPRKSEEMRNFASELRNERHSVYGSPSEDWSYIPPEAIPDGCVVQWIAHTVMGMPVQPYEIQRHLENGWQPYPLSLYPSLMPPGFGNDDVVERNGQRLYVRRKELQDQAREEELHAARAQLSSKLNETKLAQFSNSSAPRTPGSIKTSYDAIPVEE